MTKLVEHAVVPALDAAAQRRLTDALDSEGVVSAALVGSAARGAAGPLSDLDTLLRYLDTAPTLAAAQRRRHAENRFGRRRTAR